MNPYTGGYDLCLEASEDVLSAFVSAAVGGQELFIPVQFAGLTGLVHFPAQIGKCLPITGLGPELPRDRRSILQQRWLGCDARHIPVTTMAGVRLRRIRDLDSRFLCQRDVGYATGRCHHEGHRRSPRGRWRRRGARSGCRGRAACPT